MPRKKNHDQTEDERRERLAYVGALAAGLVHEVRTPLHAIQLNAQMLNEDVDQLPENVRTRFERRSRRIYTEVKALSHTLDAFLTFARPPRMDPTPMDLNRFLRELIEFVQPEMDEENIRIESELAVDMFPVVIDHNQFTHVFLNLFRNSKEAIEQQRESVEDDFEGIISISTVEHERHIEISFSDNGIGIKPEDESKIFEVFYTTKQKGTGLGLGIVNRIVEDHRGTITLKQTPPPGATFEVSIPRGNFLEFSE